MRKLLKEKSGNKKRARLLTCKRKYKNDLLQIRCLAQFSSLETKSVPSLNIQNVGFMLEILIWV